MKALTPSGLVSLAVSEGATTPVPSHTAVVWSTTHGCMMYWDGSRWTTGPGERALASSGLKLLVLGASTEARALPVWSGVASGYQRSSGVVTLTVDYALADFPMLAGQEIQVSCLANSTAEGKFAVTSCTVTAGTSMQIVYNDARADIATSALGGSFDVHFCAGYTVSGGWPAHLNLCMDGRLQIDIMATSGSNLVEDWGTARLDLMTAKGYYDVVLLGTGLIGNTIKAYGAGPVETYNALVALIKAIRERTNPRLILVETPSAARDVQPNDVTTGPIYTTAQILLRRMWTELPRTFPNVRVVPCGEAMVQNYSAYNAAPSNDVSYGWPEESIMSSDGFHSAYPWSALRGEVIADSLIRHAAPHISPEMGVLPDTVLVNTRADPEGATNKNYARGLWGNVAATQVTISSTGCSGVAPAGASMSFVSGRGSSTAVSALSTSPTGGSKWTTTITGSGSASGYTFQQDLDDWVLSALNNSAVKGHYVDLFLPMTLQCKELKLIFVEVKLVATVSSVEYTLCGMLLNQGQFSQASLGRGIEAGFDGVLRSPRFYVPNVTYTAASLRVIVREINGSVASGRTVVALDAGQRFHVVS